ncbi:MAG: 30S ribosomal protein S20 [Halanaerobiales bacterium]
MPIIKSAKKRVKTSEKKEKRNKVWKEKVKNSIKNFEKIVSEGNAVKAKEQLSETIKIIDKAAGKGILHKNNASRKKSRLTKMYNEIA